MNSSMSSSRLPLFGAEEFEGLLLEFGKTGHWSTGSLDNRLGGLPASLVASLVSPRRRPGVLAVVDLSCHGGSPFCVLLVGAAPPRFRVDASRVVDADPLPHLPAPTGRRYSLVLCFVAAGDGHGLLSRLAGWSCSQDGSPRFLSEVGG